MAAADLDVSMKELAAAMDNMQESIKQVRQLADHFRSQQKDDITAALGETRDYANKSLENVLFHVRYVAKQMTAAANAQDRALQQLDARAAYLRLSMDLVHRQAGALPKLGLSAPRLYEETKKQRKLESAEMADLARPPSNYKKKMFKLKKYDSVGLDGVPVLVKQRVIDGSLVTFLEADRYVPPAEAAPLDPPVFTPVPPSVVPRAMDADVTHTAPAAAAAAAPPRADRPPSARAAPPSARAAPPRREETPPPLPRDDDDDAPPPLPRDDDDDDAPPPLPRDDDEDDLPPIPDDDDDAPPPLPRD